MKYRREIDGLRAVAVLPVILFHAGFKAFAGGFVGVDIFFVISGYLITTIILFDMNNEKFSIVTFYERRARRILPALFFVMFCCLPFAWFWLLPNHLKDFSQSLTAISAFSSNVLFWRESGYFGTANELKPLLHTWSLAVEEQYYVLFPLFLMALWKLRKRWIFGSLVVVAISSLILAQWGAYHKPTATFFLLPMRGWELAIGALIAFYFLYRKEQAEFIASHKPTSEVLGSIGLALICYSIFAFDQSTPFPSVYALVPTVGTALIIIFSTSETVVGRLLSTKTMVGIGLLSYSTYLWHQPLFVFARHRSLTDPSVTLLLVLSVISIILAYFSWRFIEMPFRDKKAINRKKIFTFAIIGSVGFAVIGLAGHLNNGFDLRTAPNGVKWRELNADDRLAPNYGLEKKCDRSFQNELEINDCSTTKNPKIVVWGDSFAMHLIQGLLSSNISKELGMVQLTKSQCAPIVNFGRNGSIITFSECIKFNNDVINFLRKSPGIRYVIMSSPYDLKKSVVYNSEAEIVDNKDNIYAENQMIVTANLIKSFGAVPIFISPPPNNGSNLGECLISALGRSRPLESCDFKASNISENRLDAYQLLDRLKNKFNVADLRDVLCKNDICSVGEGDVFIFRDSGHLSFEGSKYLEVKNGFFTNIFKM